ncbi:hypothetical protein KFL_000280070 [Klebsormidium nitens]|uniref:Rubredoxin-like domain-containing protein n=1 Tax=Klebsormidium nitens TaxID=105231 RepID=A0A1Y1HNJ1_KLENI|nr:hypothetical protein KFL_000280070 [Klebsormidium nitens]|eukprot:GAQ79302.1 hypothetical protein KFL_000280070 [Klebsormidium nitens]
MASIASAARVAGAQSLASCVASASYGTQPQANALFVPALPAKQQAALGPQSQVDLTSSFIGTGLPSLSRPAKRIKAQASSSNRSAVVARTAAAGKQIEVDVEKPLGLTLGQKSNGVITITQVSGNAAKAGLKTGDQVVYTSSFFGDELWPADKLGFTQTAIKAKSDSVYFVVQRGGEPVNTKRLSTRKAPSRFGKQLTAAQKERATHICLDCGYIYTLGKSFEDQPDDFLCPQCRAPKTRFAGYDPETGRVSGGGTPLSVLISILVSISAIGGLFYYLSL